MPLGEFGLLEKHQNAPKFGADFLAVYNLLNTHAGLKNCRALLKELSTELANGAKLTDVLAKSETEVLDLKDVQTIYRFTFPKTFLGYLANRKVLLDYGVNGRHGLHSHRLQWWLVGAAAKGNRFIKLVNKPGDVYEELGNEKYLKDPNDEKSKSLWDDLVDLLNGSATNKQFGCPEYLNEYLQGQKKDAYAALVSQWNAEDLEYKTKFPSMYYQNK
jgi:hypothetical protein